MGAGMVLHATGTRSLDALGGLLKHMKVTGTAFIIGSLAISGLLVPYATTVNPTSNGVTPSRTASEAPPRTSHSAPKYRDTRPVKSIKAMSINPEQADKTDCY